MKIESKYALLALTAAVLLTGCQGSSTQDETKAATEAAKTEASAADTEAPETEDGTDEKATEAKEAADTEESEVPETDGAAVEEDSEAPETEDAADEEESENPETEDAADEEESEDETDDLEEESEAGELAPITPSDYLIEDASDYVELGSYDGIEVTQYTYEVTDDMVQEQIEEELQYAATEDETGEPSVEGDLVYFTFTSTIQSTSETADEEETFIALGEAEYGEEFDKNLTGVSTGDELDFSISFEEDTWMDEWVNETVDFHVEVTGVTRLDVPEYDEDFLTTYTDYTTTEDYEAAIREYLESSYLEQSYYGVIEDLLSACLDATTFTGYPESLLEECKEEVLSVYNMFAGDDTSVEEVMELFGVTDADVEEEALALVNRRLFISAYCLANDITMTEEEYVTYVTDNADYYGADSPAEFEAEYTRAALVRDLYEAKATDLLYESADITEAPYSEDDLFEEDWEELDMTEETEELSEEMTEDL